MRRLSSKSIDVAHVSAFVLALVAALSFPVFAASPEVASAKANTTSAAATAPRLQPSPLLAIDQNRVTVVDRILREWGESLPWSNAGINNVQLREMLMGLRADHLLAASLAGNLDGLRNVLANALTSTAQVAPSLLQAKALGDVGDDLVYTPVTPCRVVDSRLAGGTLTAGSTRNWLAANPAGNFTAQGGSSGNCGIPVKPAAVLVNVTAANTGGGPAYLIAWPYNQAQPLASTLNWTAANSIVANAVIVPLCTGACADDFSVYVTSATDVIVDVAGYFARPKSYVGTHVITGYAATDSGGDSNTASGDYSTVAGGQANVSSNQYATMSGGDFNTASGNGSTVAGGGNNTASGFLSTVAGGSMNTASATVSTVGGGQQNTASGNFSTVAGGLSNTASGLSADTVAGGAFNTASGGSSTVAGGYTNTASGAGSFAAGQYANANGNGCFVFGDSSTSNGVSCNAMANQFVARALGGVYFLTAGNTDLTYTGAKLAMGATAWTVYSDRAGKDNVRAADVKAVLKKLASLPIATWNWKAQDARIRHMGPMAQDFSAAFGLGEDPMGISTVDADGVAFAAIQGLHQLLQQKDATLERQQREITVLKRKLQAIEAKLGLN